MLGWTARVLGDFLSYHLLHISISIFALQHLGIGGALHSRTPAPTFQSFAGGGDYREGFMTWACRMLASFSKNFRFVILR